MFWHYWQWRTASHHHVNTCTFLHTFILKIVQCALVHVDTYFQNSEIMQFQICTDPQFACMVCLSVNSEISSISLLLSSLPPSSSLHPPSPIGHKCCLSHSNPPHPLPPPLPLREGLPLPAASLPLYALPHSNMSPFCQACHQDRGTTAEMGSIMCTII